MMPPSLTHQAFHHEKIRHAFFTREGGVSVGAHVAGLNCSEKTNPPEHYEDNLRRIAQSMAVDDHHLLFCRQIHSARVVTLENPWTRQARPDADAMVTSTRNLALGILTADCAPVLFHDGEAGVIGAAHAGWKGAFGGVLEETICAMKVLGARTQNIRAVIGPCIQQHSYEVGPEFYGAFLKATPANTAFFRDAPRTGHFLFDLPAYCLARLKAHGITEAYSLGTDTCSDEKRFFSYRRKTLRGEPAHGTLMSVIVLG